MNRVTFRFIIFYLSVILFLACNYSDADEHLHSSAVDEGMIFYCSFDNRIDADKALGNPKGTPQGPVSKRFAPGLKNQGLRIGCGNDGSERFSVFFEGNKNIDYQQGTVSFWIKPENWKPADNDFNLFVTARKSDGCFIIYKYRANQLRFHSDENKVSVSARENISSWKPGEWHHVTAVWDRQIQKIYVDGRLKHTVQRQKLREKPYSTLEIGYRGWEGERGTSIIDELKIFNRPLSEPEIDQEYNRLAVTGKDASYPLMIRVREKTPQIDGMIQPDEYPVAATGFFDLGGRYSFLQSHYYLSYDRNFLYVGIKTPQQNTPLAKWTERDGNLWEDDSIEVLLSKEPDTCHQIIFNTKGILYDARLTPTADTTWNLSNYQLANNIENGFWTAEIAIPFSDLGVSPVSGQQWKLNIARNYMSVRPAAHTCIAPVRRGYNYFDLMNFVKIILQPDASVFRIDSLGNLNGGAVDLNISTSSSDASCDVSYATAERIWFKESLRPDTSGNIHLNQKFAPNGIFSVQLNAAGQSVFAGSFQGQNPSPVAVQYIYTDIKAQLLQIVLKNESGERDGHVLLTLKDKKSGQSRQLHELVKKDQVFWTASWDIADLPVGDYDFEAQYISANGLAGEKFQQWYRKTPAVAPWNNNQIGLYPGEVPSPWIPLKTSSDRVACLTQQYTFANTLLPSGFQANEHDILSRPCELQVNDQILKAGTVKLIENKPDYAVFQTQGKLDGLTVSCNIRVEFDGMMWIKMILNGGNTPIRKLNIDIPLKPEFAEQVHSNDGDTHRAKFGATGLIPATGWHKNLYNKPAFWVGNDNAGIAWYAETLQGWHNQNRNRTMEIIPGSSETIIRLNIIDRALTLDGSRVLEFGLHGTPVKKPTALVRGNRWGTEWGYSWNSSFFYNYLDSGKEFFDKAYLDRFRKHFAEGGSNRFFQYIGSNGVSPYCPEWGYWGKIWTSRAIGNYFIELNIYNLKQRNKWVWTYACLNSKSFREFQLWQLNNVLRDPEWNIQNLYYDLVGPRMCNNTEHGCGWKDDDGNLWPTQNLTGGRDFHKRTYQLMKKINPDSLQLYHVTGQPAVPGIHSFADAVVDGETFFGNELPQKETYFGIFSPKTFRVAYNGQKWGYPVLFISQLRRSAIFQRPDRVKLWEQETPPPAMQLAARHLFGYASVHDVALWVVNEKSVRKIQDALWPLQKDFIGEWDDQVLFIPYWQSQKPFNIQSATSDRVMASAYVRASRAILVVMNDTNVDQAVKLKVDVAGLLGHGNPVRIKEADSVLRTISDGEWEDSIPARDFKIYFLK